MIHISFAEVAAGCLARSQVTTTKEYTQCVIFPQKARLDNRCSMSSVSAE